MPHGCEMLRSFDEWFVAFKLFPFLPATPRPFGRLGLLNYWGDVSPSDSTFPAAPSCNCQEIGITKISSWCMELIWESSNPLAEHLDPTNFRKAKPKWIQVVESWHILTRRKRSCVRKLSCESHNSWEQHAHYQRFSLLTLHLYWKLATWNWKNISRLPTPSFQSFLERPHPLRTRGIYNWQKDHFARGTTLSRKEFNWNIALFALLPLHSWMCHAVPENWVIDGNCPKFWWRHTLSPIFLFLDDPTKTSGRNSRPPGFLCWSLACLASCRTFHRPTVIDSKKVCLKVVQILGRVRWWN